MRRFISALLVVFVLILVPGSAWALTESEARRRIEELDRVICKDITSNNGILISSRRTGARPIDGRAVFILNIITNAGRPVPHLSICTISPTPLDIAKLRITNTAHDWKRGRIKGGEVELKVAASGVTRDKGYFYYMQLLNLNATDNEELDAFAHLAKLCEFDGNVVVELRGPVDSKIITLSEAERLALVDMWRYFTAYAFLAETYYEPPAIAAVGRYTEEGYKERFIEMLEEIGVYSDPGVPAERRDEKLAFEADLARSIEKLDEAIVERDKLQDEIAKMRKEVEAAERKKMLAEEKARRTAEEEDLRRKKDEQIKRQEQNIKDNAHLIEKYIDLYWG